MIEKILERLEEYKYTHLVERDKERLEHCTENDRAEHCEGIDCFWCVWDKATSIVQEVAKDGGWIPCSERLPDKEGTYLVTLKKWETITFARFTDIKTNPHFNALVIAWMPLPQPYTEEQKELSTTWQQQTMNRFERID